MSASLNVMQLHTSFLPRMSATATKLCAFARQRRAIINLLQPRLVQEVIVYAVPPTDIRKRKQTVDEVESEIKDRFSSIGVQVKAIRHRMDKGCYESSLVSIDPPVNLKTIWGRRLGLQNCALIEFKPTNAK